MAWAAIIECLASGKPVLPYQPRRRVPWQIWDVLAIVVFYIVGTMILISLAQHFLHLDANEFSGDAAQKRIGTIHPIVQLLVEKNWAAIFTCGIIAIVIAPVAEEFFFRVLLQGWLEKVERTWRRRLPRLRRRMPLAAAPIFISSIIFASQHFRTAAPELSTDYLIVLLSCESTARIMSLLFGILFLHWRVGAKAADFGWEPDKLLADVRLGLFTFMAIAVPIFMCRIIAAQLLPDMFAPDPIPIFFFAIALGLLYNRTHRVMPPIALHMALNATSLAMVFL